MSQVAVDGLQTRRERATAGRWRISALAVAAGILYAIPLGWGLPPERHWAYDEPDARHVVAEAFGDAGRDWFERYPPLHRLQLRLLFEAALPFVSRPDEPPGRETVEALQLLGRGFTVLYAIATLLLLHRLALRLGGPAAAWLTSLFWLGVAPQAYYAKTMNLDAPYVAWFALSLHFFVAFREQGRRNDLVGFALAGGAAILTKDQAYGLYLLPTVAILWWIFAAARARGEGAGQALRTLLADARLWLAAAALTIEFAVVYRMWNGLEEMVAHFTAITGQRWMGRYQEVPNNLAGQLELAAASWRNLVFCLGWAGAIVAVLAVAREASSRGDTNGSRARTLELLLFPASYYLTFVAVIRYSYDRFLLPVVLVMALFAGRLLAAALRPRRRAGMRWAAALAVTLLLSCGVARAVIVDLSMVEDVRVKVERAIDGDAHSIGIAGLGAQLPEVSEQVSVQRFRRRPCDRLQHADYVVFQPSTVHSEFGRSFGARLAAGAYGLRRVELEAFEPPRWLYDVQPAATNLAWINMPTWLFERDPGRPCRDRRAE